MTLRGLAERRGHKRDPYTLNLKSLAASNEPYRSPPDSRCSEPIYQRSGQHIEYWQYPSRRSATEAMPVNDDFADRFHTYRTSLDSAEVTTVGPSEVPDQVDMFRRDNGSYRRKKSHDDYGIAYSCYQGEDNYSMPNTPDGQYLPSVTASTRC